MTIRRSEAFVIPRESYAFAYVPVDDPYKESGGAVLDYVIEAGDVIEGAGRCCDNCSLIWGFFGAGGAHDGGFAPRELRPLTQAARDMLALVQP